MTAIQFLAEWALRSSIMILSGALLLQALRVKDPSIRLAAWTAMLAGSLAIPAIAAAMPKAPLVVLRQAPQPVAVAVTISETGPAQAPAPAAVRQTGLLRPFDWPRAAWMFYVVVAGALLLRLGFGLAVSVRLLRQSHKTGQATEGIEIRESDRVASPVALGIVRPAIVLPADWRDWNAAKLDAVLAHERSHIRRHDPAVQLLSAIHRALLWHSPMSWLLHQRIVRTAEEVSDDAAVAATLDRASYAEILLDFMQRGVRGAQWHGVPMARYGAPAERIQRVLDGTAVSRGVTRWGGAAILVLGAPLAYLAAAAEPQSAPLMEARVLAVPAQAAPVRTGLVQTFAPQVKIQPAPAPKPQAGSTYLTELGNVAATSVTVRSQIDGQLMKVSFQEGAPVEAGQVLATIDPRPYETQLEQAEGQITRDQAQLENALVELARLEKLGAANVIPKEEIYAHSSAVQQLKATVASDKSRVDDAKLHLSYAQVRAPIAGVAGLHLVDPGNIVHPGDATGIVVINQLQPISVLFPIPEDRVPQVRALLRDGANPLVEAWTRDGSVKIATGRLTAIDNQIDTTTGTAKLKAAFDNQDGALFPNEFVVVHLMVK